MKVLHVLPSLRQSYGGPIRAVLDLSARTDSLEIESHILGFGAMDIPDNPLGRERIHALPLSAPKRYCYSHKLVEWLRTNLGQFHGVVLHGMWLYPSWAVASACIKTGTPYACFPHGMLEPWPVFGQSLWKAFKKVVYWRLIERNTFSNARCVYFTTNRERALADETFHLGGTQRLLIPYGVENSTERVATPQNPNLLQPINSRVALFLGRVHPKKNVHLLIEAWRKAAPPAPWCLLIAGSGEARYISHLRRLIARSNLSGQVHLTGFVAGKDKLYLLQRASWFLLPSQQENFGIAVAEAISNGCPVAISDQVYFCEFMHERSEVLPLHVDAWVTFMRERMTDESWRSELITLDQVKLLPKMSIEQVSKDWAMTLSNTFGSGVTG